MLRSYNPSFCTACNKSVTRLDLHLVNFHSIKRDDEEYREAFSSSKHSCHDVEDDDEGEDGNSNLENVIKKSNDQEQQQQPSCSKHSENSSTSTSNKDSGQCSTSTSLQIRGKMVTVGTTSQPLLKYRCKINAEKRKSLRIPKSDPFRHYYKNAVDLFKDYKVYLMKACSKSVKNANETIASCKAVWMTFDTSMCLTPNQMGNPDSIEDNFVLPHIQLLKNARENPEHKQPHLQATTVQSKLNSVASLLTFSKVRMVFFGINFQQIEILLLKLKQLAEFLKPYKQDRYTYIYIINCFNMNYNSGK